MLAAVPHHGVSEIPKLPQEQGMPLSAESDVVDTAILEAVYRAKKSLSPEAATPKIRKGDFSQHPSSQIPPLKRTAPDADCLKDRRVQQFFKANELARFKSVGMREIMGDAIKADKGREVLEKKLAEKMVKLLHAGCISVDTFFNLMIALEEMVEMVRAGGISEDEFFNLMIALEK
jgi:hypothetical protein